MERRNFLKVAAGVAAGVAAASVGVSTATAAPVAKSQAVERQRMPRIKTRDGTELYVKEWGSGRPVILIHGWPLNADSLDRLAMKLAEAGHRVLNYDRRGMGRSSQPWEGYDWDSLSDDLADVMQATGATKDVTVIGYSMGGGEAARYMSRT